LRCVAARSVAKRRAALRGFASRRDALRRDALVAAETTIRIFPTLGHRANDKFVCKATRSVIVSMVTALAHASLATERSVTEAGTPVGESPAGPLQPTTTPLNLRNMTNNMKKAGRPRLDLSIGQRVGTRVVTRFLPHGRNGQTMVAWLCDCGKEGRINASGLFAASTCKSCSNSANSIASQGKKKPRSDLRTAVGDRHGSRVVTELLTRQHAQYPRMVSWTCDCGETGATDAKNFRKTLMCVRCADRAKPDLMARHGQARHNGKETRLYRCWHGMRARASGSAAAVRQWYFDKGVTICPEWSSFEAFAEWALSHGYADNLTLDRKLSCRGYNPSNCEWVTKSENTRRSRSDKWRQYDTTPIEMLWGAT
jgi:hypothetical protein